MSDDQVSRSNGRDTGSVAGTSSGTVERIEERTGEAANGNGRDAVVEGEPEDIPALGPEELKAAYRVMLTAREVDLREIALKRQNKAFFQVSSAGHEAVTAAAAALLRPRTDWVYAYYRDRALATGLGLTPLEQLAASWGAAADPSSGGRQMPSHFSKRSLGLTVHSSCVGTQFLHAVGTAHAERYLSRHRIPGLPAAPNGDGIVLVSGGDGATSEGEFWESLNSASLRRLPVLFLIQDNGYAISVPVEHQTAGGAIAPLARGFPDLRVLECDGCDYEDSYRTLQEAFDYVRSGEGPALVQARVVRLLPHSLSDEDRDYKTAAERESDQDRDPLARLRDRLTASGAATREELDGLRKRTQAEVAGGGPAAPPPPPPACGIGSPRRGRPPGRNSTVSESAPRPKWRRRPPMPSPCPGPTRTPPATTSTARTWILVPRSSRRSPGSPRMRSRARWWI